LRLGVLAGVAPVEVVRITHDEIRAGLWRRGPRDNRYDGPLQPPPVLPPAAAPDNDPLGTMLLDRGLAPRR
jgi:rare lipoprotein A